MLSEKEPIEKVYNTDLSENVDKIEDSNKLGVKKALHCVAAASTRTISIWNMISVIFLTPATQFTCVQFKGNETEFVKVSTCYDNCLKYVYTSKIFDQTLISEFDLVCDNLWLANTSQSFVMLGFLIGVFIFGWISDRFGRRIALMISGSVNSILMIAVPFSPNIWTFISLRFLIGIVSGGTLIISVVYVLETVPPKYREIAGSLALLPDGLGEALLAVFAYIANSWRTYLFQCGILTVILTVPLFFLPETPRWLALNTNKNKYSLLILKTAKSKNLSGTEIKYTNKEDNPDDKRLKTNYLDLFGSLDLALKVTSCMFIWIVCGITFFVLSQYTTFLGSNVYIIVIIYGIAQSPITYIAMILNKKFGRKKTVICNLLVTGVSVAVLIFLPNEHWSSSLFCVLGLCSDSLTFTIMYVFVSELFPTAVRSMAYGVCCAGSKIGGIVAPFIASLTPLWVPSLILTVILTTATFACMILPETKGKILEDKLKK